MNQNFDFWQQFPPKVRSEIESKALKQSFTKGEFIYRVGQKPLGVYFLIKGLVALVANSEKGTEHFLRFFKAGQFFGHRSFFAEEPYHASSQCLSVVEALFLPAESSWEILNKYPEALVFVIKALSHELRLAELQRLRITDYEVIHRVAQTLVYLKELDPTRTWTRQEIANYCASTTSTVIKTLGELESQGLIQQVGRQIEILDKNRLLQMYY